MSWTDSERTREERSPFCACGKVIMGHALNIVSYKAAIRQSDEIQSDREATEKELLASRTKFAHKSETRLD